ncbi:hypothetical protein BC832DRAFT_547929 [Gaertneriomyces semiglobifer]|nr:hypothetical protein BC832DRAFT_547929 [Gaertneriomyces semiglobifer]
MTAAATSRTGSSGLPGAENVFVEITDPQTGKTFFANIATGECRWDRPANGNVKPRDVNGIEWWELFDENHKLPYYYNTKTGETEWLRPTTGTIIPLVAIQNSTIGKRMSVLVQSGQSYNANRQAPIYSTFSPVDNSPLSMGIEDRRPSGTYRGRAESQPDLTTSNYGINQGNLESTRKQGLSSSSKGLSPSQSMAGPSYNYSGGRGSEGRLDASKARTLGISNPVLNEEAARAMNPFAGMGGDAASSNRAKLVPLPVATQSGVSPQSPHSPQPITQPASPTPYTQLSTDVQSHHRLNPNQPRLPLSLQNELSQFRIEGYAQRFFSSHRRGIFFRRKVPVEKMLVYQKEPLKAPLLVLSKNLHRDALKCFRSIQKIMKTSNMEHVIADIQTLLERGILHGGLRDEIYVQVCKQLKGNPDRESIYRGWLLLSIIPLAFPPSKNFEEYLKSYIQSPPSSSLAPPNTPPDDRLHLVIAQTMKTLTKTLRTGPRGKTPTSQELLVALDSPFTFSLFGEELSTIMEHEREREPSATLPRVLVFLADSVLRLHGTQTEGIFRVPGDAEDVMRLRMRVEKEEYVLDGITDPNVPSSLLKLFLRELASPLIPAECYADCVEIGKMEASGMGGVGPRARQVITRIPEDNRHVVEYMLSFLREFVKWEKHTKMGVGNLAMVFAPSFLRCPSEDVGVIFESTK